MSERTWVSLSSGHNIPTAFRYRLELPRENNIAAKLRSAYADMTHTANRVTM